ncbi:Crp/Fnr family transcriptional regulator (plasmid) [Skermanella rosea]|uniref:Crp/Fnr family transcriptional regulator n=1 Tax=Skermanella rosea TaxID=1817965 RepID=UPI001931BB04|nr:Crp/Fnr family transcriptional regulator [Skermanella rosea]UEM07464.1 Crp/Fnr family transcriptional regulator [Skermanella rosea]
MSQIKQSAVRNQLLAALPPADFGLLANSLTLVALPLRQTLFEADEPIGAAYFVETGMVSNLAYLVNGDAIEVGVTGSDGMVGTPLILGADTAPAGAVVQMEGTALRISAAALKQAFNESRALHARLLRYVQAFYTQVSQTAVCNGNHPLEERLARWLLMAHDRAEGDDFPMTHEFMAMMLGVRRAGVTVTAGTLKQAGMIGYSGGRMTILDRPALESASCECYGIVQRYSKQLLG